MLDPVGDTYSLKVTVDYVNTFNRVYVKNLLNECAGLSECTLKIGIVPLVAGALADNYFIMTFSAEIQQYTNNNEQGIVVSSNIGIIGSIDL